MKPKFTFIRSYFHSFPAGNLLKWKVNLVSINERFMSTMPIIKNNKFKNNWPLHLESGTTCNEEASEGKALLLGVYNTACGDDSGINDTSFTRAALKYDKLTCSKLSANLKASGPSPLLGEVRLFYNLEPSFPIVALCGLGNQCYGYNTTEERDELKEAIRIAVGAGCRAVQELQVAKIYLESFGNSEPTAEGAALSLWLYQDLKQKSMKVKIPYVGLYDDGDKIGWQIGLEKSAAQNLARHLMETPSNLMTPTNFALSAVEALSRTGVNVHVKVREWVQENQMNGFLAAAKGSCEEPIFLELLYNGCDPCVKPIVLIGKGVTFDAGGLCLKDRDDMKYMRGDLGGAACIVAALSAVSTMKLPINIRAVIPLCENMPGSRATKPGDIIKAINGKTVLIENVDNEGVLILSDAFSYSTKYDPKFIMDVGTLTSDMAFLLGTSATGVFSNDNQLWATLKNASVHTGDRVWRFPLWKTYDETIRPLHVNCDLINLPQAPGGFACAMAAFLKHFVYHYKWVHLDTWGVMVESGDTAYLRKGMSGRPTRTIIEFLAQMSCRPSYEIDKTCYPAEIPRDVPKEKK